MRDVDAGMRAARQGLCGGGPAGDPGSGPGAGSESSAAAAEREGDGAEAVSSDGGFVMTKTYGIGGPRVEDQQVTFRAR